MAGGDARGDDRRNEGPVDGVGGLHHEVLEPVSAVSLEVAERQLGLGLGTFDGGQAGAPVGVEDDLPPLSGAAAGGQFVESQGDGFSIGDAFEDSSVQAQLGGSFVGQWRTPC